MVPLALAAGGLSSMQRGWRRLAIHNSGEDLPARWMGQHSAVSQQMLSMNSRLEVVSGYLVACLILYLQCQLALAQVSLSPGPRAPFLK